MQWRCSEQPAAVWGIAIWFTAVMSNYWMRTHTRRLTDPGSAAGCLSEGYESYSNDKITCCHPPVCNVDGRSQVRKITEQGRGNSPAPLSPSAHHSLTPSFLCFNCFSLFLCCCLSFFPGYFLGMFFSAFRLSQDKQLPSVFEVLSSALFSYFLSPWWLWIISLNNFLSWISVSSIYGPVHLVLAI